MKNNDQRDMIEQLLGITELSQKGRSTKRDKNILEIVLKKKKFVLML